MRELTTDEKSICTRQEERIKLEVDELEQEEELLRIQEEFMQKKREYEDKVRPYNRKVEDKELDKRVTEIKSMIGMRKETLNVLNKQITDGVEEKHPVGTG